MGDQPFESERVHAIGAGPELVLVRKLLVEMLSQSIIKVEREQICYRALSLSHKLTKENGVGEAGGGMKSI